MSSSVVYPSTFNSKNITISAPKALKSGAKQAYLNYGGERLVMQTAVNMSVPFGLANSVQFGPEQFTVELSFRGSEQRPEIKEFMNVLAAIDEKLIDEGTKCSQNWFKDDLPREVIKKFYTPSLKYSKDKETGKQLDYPPNLKLKLRKMNNEFETKFYDVNGSPYKGVPVEDLLPKGAMVTAIIECAGVWFAGSKYGLTWRAKQIAIHKMPERLTGFAFKGLGSAAPVDDDAESQASNDDQEQDKEIDDDVAFSKPKTSVVAAMMPKATPPAPVQTPVVEAEAPIQDSVDDEDGDDVEPAPVPKKTIVKKKVIAKK